MTEFSPYRFDPRPENIKTIQEWADQHGIQIRLSQPDLALEMDMYIVYQSAVEFVVPADELRYGRDMEDFINANRNLWPLVMGQSNLDQLDNRMREKFYILREEHIQSRIIHNRVTRTGGNPIW